MQTRKRPPSRRYCETSTVEHGGEKFHYSVGMVDGLPIDIWINGAKVGSDLQALLCDAAVACSFALQYGASMYELRTPMTQDKFGAASSVMGKILDDIISMTALDMESFA